MWPFKLKPWVSLEELDRVVVWEERGATPKGERDG